MLVILLFFRFRERTSKHEEILIALGNIIIDKVPTVQITKQKKFDTSAPLEIGMAPKDESDSSGEEGDARIMENGQRQLERWKGPKLERKGQ